MSRLRETRLQEPCSELPLDLSCRPMCLFLEALVFAGRGDEALALWQSASERGLRVLSRTLTRLSP